MVVLTTFPGVIHRPFLRLVPPGRWIAKKGMPEVSEKRWTNFLLSATGGVSLGSTTTTNDFDLLEDVVTRAHEICNRLLLFETVCVSEQELRLVLERSGVTDPHLQDQYLILADEYKKYTGGD